jgi:starvation-inducible outer membrane lipoprotein
MTQLLTAIVMAALLAACMAGPDPVMVERYCYRTLAEVDCHAQPLPGEASREVGFFDQAALN